MNSIRSSSEIPIANLTSPSQIPNYNFKSPIAIGVMASGEGSNFEAISNSIKNNILQAEIKLLIVNNENCKARKRADRLGIPCIFISHTQFSNREEVIMSRLGRGQAESSSPLPSSTK